MTRVLRLALVVLVASLAYGVAVGDVHPLRIRPCRVERDSERFVQATGECARAVGLRHGITGTQYNDTSGSRLGDEEIAIGRDPDHARALEASRETAHRKSGRDLQCRPVRRVDHAR